MTSPLRKLRAAKSIQTRLKTAVLNKVWVTPDVLVSVSAAIWPSGVVGFRRISEFPLFTSYLQAMAKFLAPVIQDNPSGWGPCAVPEKFKDMPYQPFSKGDRLGKVRSPCYYPPVQLCSRCALSLSILILCLVTKISHWKRILYN